MQCACATFSSVACLVLHCVSTLSHWTARFSKITLLNTRLRFHFLYTFVCNIFHSKKNWATCDHKCVLIFMQSICFAWLTLMKLEFSRQIFEKYSNYISWKSVLCEPSWSMRMGGLADGRTWRSL